MIRARINGMPIEAEEGTSILDAARKAHIKIPTLCKHQDLAATAACGICVVRVNGSSKMLRACSTILANDMEVTTHDPEIVALRRTTIQLILSKHPDECLTCGRNGGCELQDLAADFGIRRRPFPPLIDETPLDDSTKAIILDPRKCLICGRCTQVCQEIQNVWALSMLGRGVETRIAPAGDISLADSPCVRCGQCSAHCPTGAIFEHDDTNLAWKALRDTNLYCIVQIAPAVRVALGEAFGYEPGTNLTGKIYAALRYLGFKSVFDTNFAADVTVMEEAAEFAQRFVKGRGELPLITSCCPSWVDFMEKFYGDMIRHFSTCKSPHQILGVLSKTYFAQSQEIDPAKLRMISIMPCTAKKYEISRTQEMFSSGYQDVDIVLTTRELARMIKQAGIDFTDLEEQMPDQLLGQYSGAGAMFGVTGGVMEAALRTAHKMISETDLEKVEFEAVRGLKEIKEAQVAINGHEVRVAVAHGLANVATILDKVREAAANGEEPPYHFIEVMACPGGCIGGGGQPYGVTDEIRARRAQGIHQHDHECAIRCAHDNPMVQKLYEEFLVAPLSEKSKDLLHTEYSARPIYVR
ncbi:NADH-dependent [FeFe] hydrogenase, group A6 [Candidatus Sumerlaeota bacterium]